VPDESPAARLRAALELFEVGEAMLRSRLRRERPDADEAEIEAEIALWLQRRPGAEFGDFPGPASTRRLSIP
jgi:Rv0078B-related antitoxin